MRVLACGGRAYALDIDTSSRHPICTIKTEEALEIGRTLAQFKSMNPEFTELVEGCAPGADVVCGLWAAFNGIILHQVPAEWKQYDSSAGPKRNQRMLDEFKPEIVIAFPGGVGSENMCKKARAAGLLVVYDINC